MNISGIFDILQYNQYSAGKNPASAASSFMDMLSIESTAAHQTVGIRESMYFVSDGKTILRLDAVDDLGREQSITVEYTEDSTPEDPIVKIYGKSHSGSYSYTRRIRDIDLEYATYPEMRALLAHQNALEMEKNGGGIPVKTEDDTAAAAAALANGELTLEHLVSITNGGDFSEKRNFLAEYSDTYSLDYISLDIQITADETKTVTYGDGMSPEQAAEQAEFERLMRTIDYVIEQQKKQAEIAAEKAEKEQMERLFEAKQYEREQLIERTDEKKMLEVFKWKMS